MPRSVSCGRCLQNTSPVMSSRGWLGASLGALGQRSCRPCCPGLSVSARPPHQPVACILQLLILQSTGADMLQALLRRLKGEYQGWAVWADCSLQSTVGSGAAKCYTGLALSCRSSQGKLCGPANCRQAQNSRPCI